MNRLNKITMLFCIAGLTALGCAPNSLREAVVPSSDQLNIPYVDETSSVLNAWAKLETQPGEPHIDYDPLEILVTYKPNPEPMLVANPGVSVEDNSLSFAASMPNAILRENRQYEPITDAIATGLGLTIQQQVYQGEINAASFRLQASMDGDAILTTLRQRYAGQVEHAVYSPLHHGAYVPNDPDFMEGDNGRQWELWRVGCPEAWDYELGDENVLIAVVDTGVRLTHEELAGQVLDPQVAFPGQAFDVVNNDYTMEDLDGHGTFIAGLAIAAGDNALKMTGVAPGCRVLPVKVCNELAVGAQTLDIIAGCLLAYNSGAKVVNLSFSVGVVIPIEQDMVDQIWNGGAVVVSVAGNYGDDTIQYPGAYDNAVCVGGTNKEDTKWEFSNFGTSVDIAAPGMRLRSCTNNDNDSGYYSNGSGTSYSAGIVSGAFGLLFSLDTNVTNVIARQGLESSGIPVPGFTGVVNRMDVGEAISALVNDNLPVTTQLGISPGVCGQAIGEGYLHFSSPLSTNVAKVTYTLDLVPVGEIGENDIVMSSTMGDVFLVQLIVPPDCINQQARVTSQCFNSFDIPGNTFETTVLIYNHPGDTDCDGFVNAQDVEFLKTKMGLTEIDPDFSIFADTNVDGVIDETDLAWIGYEWND